MDVKNRGFILATILLFQLFCFSFAFIEEKQLLPNAKTSKDGASSVVFPIQGNVYPLGYYTVSLSIGNPPKTFDLDIDTGSDLTWVECDAPCVSCSKPRDKLYKPHGNIVPCVDPLCAAVQSTTKHPCKAPNEQCDYDIKYADHGTSSGVLVRDNILLRLTKGTVQRTVDFGCGYNQKFSGPNPPSTAGVLGLGNGKVGILSQLHTLGLIRNVAGHCLSGRGGGFIFLGDIPSSGIVWTPMLHSSSDNHYTAGPADIFFNGKPTSVKGLQLIFDSGSTYTYLNSQALKAVVDLVTSDLKGKPLSITTEDRALPICWKGAKPFKSLGDVRNYFKPLALSFTNSKNLQLQLQLPPEAYLIVTNHGNACLGILNGTEVGLGNSNLIGDISLQDKLVVYDNEKQRIGWVSGNCARLPKL